MNISTIINFLINNDTIKNILIISFLNYFTLKLFYKTFELKWPELYFSTNDIVALYVSASLKRYIFFRFLPFFISITFFAGVFMKDFATSEVVKTTVFSAFLYGFFTDIKAIFYIIKKSPEIKTYFNKQHQILIHFITFLFFLIIGYFSGYIAKNHFIKNIFPTIQGLVDNLWSSFFVVIFLFYIKKILSEEGLSEDYIFKNSLSKIDPRILKAIDYECKKFSANKNLVKAICIAENIQRPSWFRKIELIFGIFKKEGTYGIMQVKSKKPLSDIESISLAIEKFFKNTANIKDISTIKNIIFKYNNDKKYVEVIMKIMNFLDYNYSP